MRLTAKVVGDVLETTLGYRVEMNPYGFTLENNPSVRWKRATGDFVESHCGRWQITPVYGGLTRPESYKLWLDGKCIDSGSTQRECKGYVVEHARLRSGSGIGGQSAVWGLVRLPKGEPITMKIDTKAKLVRAVLEFMAGPPPTPLSDYTTAQAKRVIIPRTGESRFVWYRRLKKRPWPRVALVPFGAAQR